MPTITTRNPKPLFLKDLGHMYKTALRVKVKKKNEEHDTRGLVIPKRALYPISFTYFTLTCVSFVKIVVHNTSCIVAALSRVERIE